MDGSHDVEAFAETLADVYKRQQQGRDSLVYALGDGEKKEIRMDKIVYGYQPNDLGFFGKCGIFLQMCIRDSL